MSKHEVWGFTIETSPSGKNIWPIDLKREATRRIREDGLPPGDIAAELGAHECLVRKWWVADRRSRGEHIAVQGPAFAEIRMAEESQPPSAPLETRGISPGFARFHSGALCFEFPVSIPEADLMKLIRVAGLTS
ncbi:hypothetical protein [Leisingera sp. JC1]|uniref:hypothetical protein n=1 Tax=Leisingera sp. JC1 TaxID=1855282 RepID=UPI0008036324|nr:hypothetical protein [Leisingera sp. JC1]OBY28400.1 hypothetical protein A9D60_24815 [Leisingera sp. JC1]